jgi:rhodanese-related sulfurtransferase
MNVLEFSKKITESGVVILDVRTPDEVAEGFIDGARVIDFQDSNFESDIASLSKEVTYAVYCRSGNRSGKAIKIMQEGGFQNLFNLDGGILDWVEAGMPLANK